MFISEITQIFNQLMYKVAKLPIGRQDRTIRNFYFFNSFELSAIIFQWAKNVTYPVKWYF